MSGLTSCAPRMDLKLHQALRDVEKAKERIMSCDYVAARKILLNIQCYLPAFDNISGMIAVCDVLHSAGIGFLGCDPDCYWVLEVSPSATEFAIKTQYNKLVALLEPIQDNFPYAASALKVVHDAFAVLAEPNKRSMFDMKRAMGLQSCTSGNLLENHAVDSPQGYIQTVKWKEAELKSIGYQCGMLNETKVKATGDHTSDGSANFQKEINGFSAKFPWVITSTISTDQDRHKFVTRTDVFAAGQVWATYDDEGMPRNYAKIIYVKVHESPCKIYVNWLKPAPDTAHGKKWCEAGLPMVCGLYNLDRSRTTPIEPTSFSHMVSPNESDLVEIYPRKGEVWAIYKDVEPLAWCSNPRARKRCSLQIVEILSGYSSLESMLVVGLVKVKGLRNVYTTENDSESYFQIPGRNLYMFSHRIPAQTYADEEMDRLSNRMFKLDPLAVSNCFTPAESIPPLPLSETEPVNQKRTTKDFASGQVWAVYDGPDSMPRRYVAVNNVVSESEICVTFLEPYSILIDEIHWIKENLPFGCGLFEAGKTTLNLKLSMFSHVVKCERNNLFYKIFPNKGEIWAKYRNWSSGWKLDDFINCQCGIVEIVTDYSDESGLLAANLEEVAGCSTFFRRQFYDGFQLVRAVPLTEMLSFSHQIPAYILPEAETHNIPPSFLAPRTRCTASQFQP